MASLPGVRLAADGVPPLYEELIDRLSAFVELWARI